MIATSVAMVTGFSWINQLNNNQIIDFDIVKSKSSIFTMSNLK